MHISTFFVFFVLGNISIIFMSHFKHFVPRKPNFVKIVFWSDKKYPEVKMPNEDNVIEMISQTEVR